MAPEKAGRRPRRRFTEEFKAGATLLVLNEGKSISAVARELDLTLRCCDFELLLWLACVVKSKDSDGETLIGRESVYRSAVQKPLLDGATQV